MVQRGSFVSANVVGAARLIPAVLAALLALLLLVNAAGGAWALDRVSGRRAALVVGNSAYEHLRELPNAVNDAERIREVLERANFEVTLGQDLDKVGLEEAILGFLRSLNDGDVALFYYSGHAVQVAGQNYVLPVDASLTSSYDLEVEAHSITSLLQYMRESSSLQIMILDACRDNPFANEYFYVGQKKVAVGDKKGLASVAPRQGTLIVYSTAPDQVAFDGPGDLSPFTGSFSDRVLKPNVEVRQLLADIRADVLARTEGRQTPWDASSLTTSFYFVRRQNLLIVEDMREVRVPPGGDEVALDITPPISSGEAALSVAFTKMPDNGSLWLSGEQVTLDSTIEAARIQDVVFRPEADGYTGDEVRYTVTTSSGRSANGIVSVVVDETMVAEQKIRPRLAIHEGIDEPVQVAEAEEEAEPAEPILVAMASDIGTGFAALPEQAVRSTDAPAGWLRLENRPPEMQVAVGDEIISEGDLIKVADLPNLRIRPSLKVVASDPEPDEAAPPVATAPAKEPGAPEPEVAEADEPARETPAPVETADAEPAAPTAPEPARPAPEPVVVAQAPEPQAKPAPAPKPVEAARPAPAQPVRTAASSQAPKLIPAEPVPARPAPVEPRPATVEPEPAPVEARPAPVEPGPAPVERRPAPVEVATQAAPAEPQAPVRTAAAPAMRTITLVPASAAAQAPAISINLAVSVNRCDELAAEPLDVQGVADGVLPNDIEIEEARAACEEAVRRYPEVARFKYQYGRVLYAAGEFDAAIAQLSAAFDAGHVRAGVQLGKLYQIGAGVERDPARAITMFEAGARRGDAYAQNWLAKALINGIGTQVDVERGMQLYAASAESGHTFAMNGIGAEYLYGRHVPQDAARALRFFTQSAGRDDVYGVMNLGVLYRDGAGVEKDLARATELFEKAHADGHPFAATALGLMAREREADAAEQLGWFRQSAARGDAWGAFHAAGLLYANPAMADEDGEAVRLLGLAASHNTAEVSDRARDILAQADGRLIGAEVQRTLTRMGRDVGAIDGILGAKSREAIAGVLGADAPAKPHDILIELLRREWIASRPRLDML